MTEPRGELLFPSIGKTTIELDEDGSIVICQEGADGHETDMVIIPDAFIEIFVNALYRLTNRPKQ